MIIMCCGFCKSRELKPSGFYMQFVCQSCGRTLELFNVEYVSVDSPVIEVLNPALPSDEEDRDK